jgi:hypothetical protein
MSSGHYCDGCGNSYYCCQCNKQPYFDKSEEITEITPEERVSKIEDDFKSLLKQLRRERELYK